ncbi:MAG TPA: DUF892 family protein [Actinomycetota bacterium]|nr:DUF892 family protein [Actinomycetota bacterium]
MSEPNLSSMLASYVRDAHAMEENVLVMLDSMIRTTEDEQMRQRLEEHKTETQEHSRLLEERLDAMDTGGTAIKDIPARMGAFAKGMADLIRSDKPGKNARDGYVTEHLEIAAYQLLERLAERAGDHSTAEVARRIRADEERMAEFINERWDRVLEMTLVQEEVDVTS